MVYLSSHQLHASSAWWLVGSLEELQQKVSCVVKVEVLPAGDAEALLRLLMKAKTPDTDKKKTAVDVMVEDEALKDLLTSAVARVREGSKAVARS